jgi:phage-related protein
VIDFLRENTDVVKVFMAVLAGAAAVAMIAALAAGFVALFNPVTLIIGAIAAAAAGVYYAWTRFETFRNVVTGAFEVIKTAAQAWWTVVKFVFDNVLGGTEGIGRAINIMKAVFTTGFNAMKNIVMGLYDAIKKVVDIAIRAKNAVGSAVDVASNIPGVGAVTSTIGNIAGAIWPFAEGGIVTQPHDRPSR